MKFGTSTPPRLQPSTSDLENVEDAYEVCTLSPKASLSLWFRSRFAVISRRPTLEKQRREHSC